MLVESSDMTSVLVRLPVELKKMLRVDAAANDRSMNAQIVDMLVSVYGPRSAVKRRETVQEPRVASPSPKKQPDTGGSRGRPTAAPAAPRKIEEGHLGARIEQQGNQWVAVDVRTNRPVGEPALTAMSAARAAERLGYRARI
jgi:hypothetical protein